MRRKLLSYSLYGLILFSLALQAGCGSARRGEPFAGPMPITSETVAQGEKVYMAYCQQCHPGGEAGLGPALNNKPLPGFLMKFQVRHGLGAMPGFSSDHIGDGDLDALIAYVKALRRHEAVKR